jgi:hypothetical protein
MEQNKPRDFGDIVEQLRASKKEEKRKEREASDRLKEELRRDRLALLRPLLKVMEQTEAKYPKVRMCNMDWYSVNISPGFRINGTTRVVVSYDSQNGFSLQLVKGGGMRVTRICSKNYEDTIPPLLELLVEAVDYFYPSDK